MHILCAFSMSNHWILDLNVQIHGICSLEMDRKKNEMAPQGILITLEDKSIYIEQVRGAKCHHAP